MLAHSTIRTYRNATAMKLMAGKNTNKKKGKAIMNLTLECRFIALYIFIQKMHLDHHYTTADLLVLEAKLLGHYSWI